MPLYLSQTLGEQLHLAVWEINESDEFFQNSYSVSADLLKWLGGLHPLKRKEYLASRYLIHNQLGIHPEESLFKDQYGKVHSKKEDLFISISHSHRFAAAAWGQQKMGVDLQVFQNKICSILPKFLNDEELQWLEEFSDEESCVKNAVLFWSLKEAVYKCYGKKEISFRNQIHLQLDHKSDQVSCREAYIEIDFSLLSYQIKHGLEAEFAWATATHQ